MYAPDPSEMLDPTRDESPQKQKKKKANRVTFSNCFVTVHEVTPYSEIYDIHSCYFDYGRRQEPVARSFVCDASCDSDSSEMPITKEQLLEGVHASFTLPGAVTPGCLLDANVFGADLTFCLPEGAVAGQVMRCTLVDGIFLALLYATKSAIPIAKWEFAVFTHAPPY